MKVLHYVYGLNIGGAETFLLNFLNAVHSTVFTFDFCVQSEVIENNDLENAIIEQGGQIHFITPYNKRPLKNKSDFKRLIEKYDYDVVHVHLNSLLNYFPINLCVKKGIKVVVHSHNSKSNGGKIGNIIHCINKSKIKNFDIGRLSCGLEAGEWFFGDDKFCIINNGIATDNYKYKSYTRETIRKQLGIPLDCTVLGHVGRFTEQKNHQFIIDVFHEYLRCNENAFLILIGDGERKEKIAEKVKRLGIEKNVVFCGNVNNVNEYLSSMDIMLFPSLYEGLPFTLIEAQAAGLPILASDSISNKVKITDLVNFKSLKDDLVDWVDTLMSLNNMSAEIEREKYFEIVKSTKYDSNKLAGKLIEYYRMLLEL